MTDELDIERFTEHDGALYTGNGRAAMWQWLYGGYTQVVLIETVNGQEIWYDGWTPQGEKADGICQRWIEEGTANLNFRPYERTTS